MKCKEGLKQTYTNVCSLAALLGDQSSQWVRAAEGFLQVQTKMQLLFESQMENVLAAALQFLSRLTVSRLRRDTGIAHNRGAQG